MKEMRKDCPYGVCPCIDCMECFQEGKLPDWLQEQWDDLLGHLLGHEVKSHPDQDPQL